MNKKNKKYIHYIGDEKWLPEYSNNTTTDPEKVTCPVCIFELRENGLLPGVRQDEADH